MPKENDSQMVSIKDPPILHDLKVSLEDLLHGCTKKVKITRQRFTPDRQSLRNEEKLLEIEVKKGWKAGTKITFPNEGDEGVGKQAADIIFTIQDIPHPHFKRDGSDLIYTHKVGLLEAILGTRVEIPTLSGNSLPLKLGEDIKPNSIYRVVNEGLPFPKEPIKRGDLIIILQMDNGSLSGDMPKENDSQMVSIKDPPILHDLKVSLEDLLHGCTKKVKITRQRFTPDRQSLRNEEKLLEIEVKKGWKAGTKITFPNEGDEGVGKQAADIIFTIQDIPHPHFKRDGSDLIYTHKVGLLEAILGTRVEIPTLSGNSLPLKLGEDIKPNSIYRVVNEGLPIPKEPMKRGDLIIILQIVPDSSLEVEREEPDSKLLEKDSPILHDLQVSLEDLLHGCTKKIKITRQKFTPDRQSLRNEEKLLEIEVKKGWKAGTKITFPNEGDEGVGKQAADIIFTIQDIPHPHFKRDGSDLIYTCNVIDPKTQGGKIFDVPTLSGKTISLMLKEDIKPKTFRRIANEGLPFPKEPSRRGDLVVYFKVIN